MVFFASAESPGGRFCRSQRREILPEPRTPQPLYASAESPARGFCRHGSSLNMSVREKTILPNEIYFITFTILGWQKVFISDKYCQLVFKWFDYAKNIYGNKLHGYVIMPNHIHCLLYISEKSKSLPILIFNAKRFLAYGIVKLLEEERGFQLLSYFQKNKIKPRARHKVFEDRYDSQIIQSRKFFLEKLNYIHNNLCSEKWRLARNPENYQYSSASNYVLGKGLYEVDLVDF